MSIQITSIAISLLVVGLAWYPPLLNRERWNKYEYIRTITTISLVSLCLLWIVDMEITTRLSNIGILPDTFSGEGVAIVLTVLGVWWMIKLHKIDHILEDTVANRYGDHIAPIAENVWDVSVYLVFGIFVLQIWEIPVTTLLAPAGIIGLTLGFAARKSLSNFFGSLSLYSDQTYKIGDYIETTENNGVVRDISIRSTTLQTLDGNLMSVPNSELSDTTVVNRSEPTQKRRIRSEVSVSYEADPDYVEDVLETTAREVSVVKDPEVCLKTFGDSGVVFEVLVWVEGPEVIEERDLLNRKIYTSLQDGGIEIPYPKIDLE